MAALSPIAAVVTARKASKISRLMAQLATGHGRDGTGRGDDYSYQAPEASAPGPVGTGADVFPLEKTFKEASAPR